ncbi:MAG: hypothetical protein RL416_100 [Pseudomonadota bacterium]
MYRHDKVDLVILGGGCAGLSLASRLAEFGVNAPKVLIVEQREHYFNDRTWCFWDIENPKCKSLASYAWSKFEVSNYPKSHVYECSQHPYLMLESHHFYEDALANIQLNPNIQLILGEEVLSSPIKTQDRWQVKTTNTELSAKLVVDTRPPKQINHQDATLWQCFVGYEIETQFDYFTPEKMTLMAFDPTFKNGLAFIYILPTSGKKALIEYTVFSENFIAKAQLVTHLKKFISQKIDGQAYQILRTEHGTLPMGNQLRPQDKDSSFLQAGLFSGSARPSSGYAFQRIQMWSKKCAESIVKNNMLYAFPKDHGLQSFMDKLFLNVIKNNSKIAASIFEDLFSQCDLKTVIKFMSDQASLKDYFHIIRSLRPWPFIRALPRFFIQAILNRVRLAR